MQHTTTTQQEATMRTLAQRDPEWAAFLKDTLARAERLREFIGDDRAANAMLAESAAWGDPADMAEGLRGRVDQAHVPTRELIRWGV